MTRARNLAGLSTVTAQPTVTTPVHLGPLGVVTATKYYGTFDHTNIIATSEFDAPVAIFLVYSS